MAVLKKIGVLSAAKLSALLYAILGLIVGVIVAIFGVLVSTSGSGIMGLGLISIIFFPIFYGVLGFIGGAIMAGLYNLVAGWIGGIELDID